MQAETTEQGVEPTYTSPNSPPGEAYLVTSTHVPCGPSSNHHPTYPMSNATHAQSTNSDWGSGTAPGTTQQTIKPTGRTSHSVSLYPTPSESPSDEYPPWTYPEPTYSVPEETYSTPMSAESTVDATPYPSSDTTTENDYYPPPPPETISTEEEYYPAPTDSSGGEWPTSTIPVSAESTVDAVHPTSTTEESHYPPATTMVTSSRKPSSSAEKYYPPPPVSYDYPPSYQFKPAPRL